MLKIIRFLSSMKIAFWSVISLILWFLLGGILSAGPLKKSFVPMNDMLIIDWLAKESSSHPWVLAWFIGLCLTGGLVTLSFIFCTSTTLLKPLRPGKVNIKAILLFAMHTNFILIVVFHVISMVAGSKTGYVKAFESSSLPIDSKHHIIISELHFVADPKLLMSHDAHAKIKFTRENFNPDENFVKVTVFRDQQQIKEGNIYLMKPLVAGQIRVTLDSFFIDRKSGDMRYGARLTLSRNPVLLPFFVLYGMAVVLLLIYGFITWSIPGKISGDDAQG